MAPLHYRVGPDVGGSELSWAGRDSPFDLGAGGAHRRRHRRRAGLASACERPGL